MTLPPALGLSLALHCPLDDFVFLSVSPFCPAYNLGWINDFRSDSPLNSASAAPSYLEALALGHLLARHCPAKSILLIVLCTEVSRVVVSESCCD